MNFTETNKIEKEIGFIGTTVKRGNATSDEVKFKFDKLIKSGETTKRSKFTTINGIPHKSVNGKLVPLTKI